MGSSPRSLSPLVALTRRQVHSPRGDLREICRFPSLGRKALAGKEIYPCGWAGAGAGLGIAGGGTGKATFRSPEIGRNQEAGSALERKPAAHFPLPVLGRLSRA